MRKLAQGGGLTAQEKQASRRISRGVYALSTASPESRFSGASATSLATSRLVLRIHSSTACGLDNLRSDFPIEAWLKAA
jgi:hypothetical protein